MNPREEFIAYMAVLQEANLQRLRDLAETLGADPNAPELPALAWQVTTKEAARFIAVGMADRMEREARA